MKSLPIPHMLWNSTSFTTETPTPPPTLDITASIMQHAHQSLCHQWKDKLPVLAEGQLSAYPDTCAQTCTSGPEISITPIPTSYPPGMVSMTLQTSHLRSWELCYSAFKQITIRPDRWYTYLIM